MFLPRVREEVCGTKNVSVMFPLGVACADVYSEKLLDVLNEFMPYGKFVPCEAAVAAVEVAVVPGISAYAEYYELCIRGGKISIRAKDYRGLVNAAATLARAIKCENGAFLLPDVEIRDYPDSVFRSFMVDPARNVIPMDEMRALIVGMAKSKFNKLHMHLSDGQGYAFASEQYPDLPKSPGPVYSKEDLQALVAYAGLFGIDIIPEIDVPAHSTALTGWMPELKCKVRAADGSYENISGWNMCLANEKGYTFIANILSELAAIFPYEYIHVGTDEMDMRDIKRENPPYSYSCRCEVCNALFAPMGLDTLNSRFEYFVRRIYKIVTALGKKMMMWNDDVDISKSPDIPHDILIEFWRVAAPERGPVEGCSMQRFLDEGFEVVNADFPNAYLDEYIQWDQLKNWNIKREPADAGERAYQILGGEMCAWEGSNYPHYLYSTYYAFPAFGDRVWNLSPIGDEKAATLALTRACLGCDCPNDFDLFAFLCGVPLGDARAMDGNIFKSDADKEVLRKQLEQTVHASRNELHLARALMNLL